MNRTPSAGLSVIEAAMRLESDGYNEMPAAERRGVLRILFEVMRQPMFALLIAGGVIYLLLGDRVEAILLLVFASLSVVITIVQESRSERVLEALRNLASPRALVIRDGKREQIAGREVVRGDLIVIGEGDRVAADATLIKSHDLMLDESLLTGESVPVRKLIAIDGAASNRSRAVPGGEDLPYVFAGTLVVRGTAQALDHATGARSEMGKIGKELRTIETEQPQLQRQMGWLIRDFAIVGAIAGGLTVLLFGLLRGSWLQAMLGGIALGMSLLPEEFPLVMTVFMAMGAWRISQARVLTRRAAAIETLGATTVLCTDKTGTLTENRMTVVSIGGDAPLSRNTENQYDALNRLDQITDPNSGITQLGYDANDNLASVKDPRTLTTGYTHNGFNDLTHVVSPDTGTTTNTYDSGGNLSTSTDARTDKATYSYDALNRMTQVAYSDQTIKFTYDSVANGNYGVGRLTGASDANHTLAWNYDEHGRVIGKGQTIGKKSRSVGYSYTNDDMTTLMTPSGETMVYGYTNHRITSITVNGTVLLNNVTYDPFGPVNGWTWGDASTVSRSYNQDGGVTAITTAGDAIDFGYDNASRINSVTDTGTAADTWSTIGYDLLDRLTGATKKSATYGWTYDANGNRQSPDSNGKECVPGPAIDGRIESTLMQ